MTTIAHDQLTDRPLRPGSEPLPVLTMLAPVGSQPARPDPAAARPAAPRQPDPSPLDPESITVTMYAAPPRMNWPAIASVSLGIVGLVGAAPTVGLLAVASVMAVVFGHVAQAHSGSSRLGTAGMVLGYLVAVPTALVWLSIVVLAALGAAVF